MWYFILFCVLVRLYSVSPTLTYWNFFQISKILSVMFAPWCLRSPLNFPPLPHPISPCTIIWRAFSFEVYHEMRGNRLPRVMKHYCPTGRRNHGRPLKRLLDTWDWNGSTSGPTPWHIWWWWWWWWWWWCLSLKSRCPVVLPPPPPRAQ
jgi:hypothetical protein